MTTKTAFAALLLAGMLPTALEAQSAATITESAVAANQAVDRAAEALGGRARLAQLASLEFGYEGEAFFPYQGPRPDHPGSFDYTETTLLGLSHNRMQTVSGFTGGETAFTRTSDFDGSRSAALAEFARQARQSPHAVIRAFLDNPRGLVLSGRNATHEILAGPVYGMVVHAHIDRRTGLVDRIEWPMDDARRGDSTAVIEFLGYRAADGWMVPDRLRVTEAGHQIFDLAYSVYRFAPGDAAERLVEPTGEETPAAGQAEAAAPEFERPSTATFLHCDYGAGVRMLFNTGGPGYHSLAVASDDGVVLIEAPGSVENGRTLAARAAELGPIRHVAATHHHGDHSAGIAGAVDARTRLIVAEGHRDFFRDMLTAPRHFLGALHEPVAEPVIETVPFGGEFAIADSVLALDAGPSGHVDQHLVFYLPRARLLFQTDMAVFRWDGSVEPGRTQSCRLLDFIGESGLEVEVIAGGHGRPGTLGDLEQAVAMRTEPCP